MPEWYELPVPGRNELCRCGSGRKLKRCCLKLYENEPNTSPIAGAFLSHEWMWAGDRTTYDGVESALAKIPGDWLVRVLSSLQWILKDELVGPKYQRQLAFIEEFGDPIVARKAAAWLKTGRAATAFHRCTIPATLQMRMLATDASAGVSDDTVRDLVGLLFQVNDLLSKDYEEAQGGSNTSAGVDSAIAADFHRNGFYSHTPHWGASTARAWALLSHGSRAVKEKYPLEWCDMESAYRNTMGGTPQELIAVVSGILSHYLALTLEKSNEEPGRFRIGDGFLEALNNADVTAMGKRAIRQLAGDWNRHVEEMKKCVRGPKENVQQFFSLYNLPLAKEGTSFFPIDMEFLRAQTTEGWYWALVRELGTKSDGKKQVQRLHASFGRAFEWYCADLARATNGNNPAFRVWTDWDAQIESDAGCAKPDIIVEQDGVLWIAEVTTSAVRPAVSVCCDADELESALTGVWFEGSSKLLQLERAYSGVKAGKVRVRDWDLRQAREIAPIFVSLRYVPLHAAIWPWYRDIMMRRGLSAEFLNRLRILDAEDLEELCASALDGQSAQVAFASWMDSIWQWSSFEDWRSANFKGRKVHPRVGTYIDEYGEAVRQLLGISTQN